MAKRMEHLSGFACNYSWGSVQSPNGSLENLHTRTTKCKFKSFLQRGIRATQGDDFPSWKSTGKREMSIVLEQRRTTLQLP